MQIHVSREYQEVIVPEGERFYVFARCPDCKDLCYISDPEVAHATEETGEPYAVMELPDEEFGPLRNLTISYESLLREATGSALKVKARRLETRMSELAENIFAPYLIGVQ